MAEISANNEMTLTAPITEQPLNNGKLGSSGKKGFKRALKKYWQLYLILLLPLIWLIVFKYIPMLGLQIAFKNYSARGGIWGSKWVGFDHFIRFFNSPKFLSTLWNTIAVSLFQLVLSFPVPIILALMINACTKKRFAKVVQTAIYLPHFISTVVIVGIMVQLLNPLVGLNGTLCRLLGIEAKDIMADPKNFRILYVFSHIWQNAGWGTIIYLANLSNVDPALHEAAEVDGASRFKRLIHVDLPAIIPTAVIMLIMNAGKVMNIGFEKVWLMQNSLNLATSEVISTLVYKVGLTAGGNYSYSAAISLFNGVINIVLITLFNKVAKKKVQTSLW